MFILILTLWCVEIPNIPILSFFIADLIMGDVYFNSNLTILRLHKYLDLFSEAD